jgi:ATP-dependent helicase/DNAse subunit B
MPRGSSRQEVLDSLPEEWQGLPLLSYTQMMQFDRCAFAWYLNKHLEVRSPVRSRALDTGSYVHSGLQVVTDRIIELDQPSLFSPDEWINDKLPQLVMEWSSEIEQTDQLVSIANAQQILTRYIGQGYVGMFGAHTPVETEAHFIILVETPRGRKFLLQGYVDLITYDDKGRLFIWDHKTGKKFWSDIEIIMDTQLPVYEILLVSEGINAAGLVINQLNSYPYKDPAAKRNDELFRREFTYRTPIELGHIREEFVAMADALLDVAEGVQPARRSLKKECKMCTYNGVCLNLLKGYDEETAIDIWRDNKLSRIPVHVEQGEGITIDLD